MVLRSWTVAVWMASTVALGTACSGTPDDTDGDDTEVSDSEDSDGDTETTDTDTEDTEDSDDPPDTDIEVLDAATVELAGACALDKRAGNMLVTYTGEYSAVDGTLTTGVVPVEVLTDQGGNDECRLLKRELYFCEGGCAFDETCGPGGECVDFPTELDMGTIDIYGLKKPVSLTPFSFGNGFTYVDTTLPIDAMLEGEVVTMKSAGGPEVGPMELHGVGVTTITRQSDDTWILYEGQPLTMQWDASEADPNRSEIYMRIDIDQHGVSPVRAFCTFEDDGEGVLPFELVDELIQFGVTGFPNVQMFRRTMDHTMLPNDTCMELEVRSPVIPAMPQLRVDGYIPCLSSDVCPDGQVCDTVIEICVDE